MKNIAMLARWTLVFGVLGLFTLQTAAVFGFGRTESALAESAKSEKFKKEDKFVVVENESEDEDRDDRTHHTRNICALNQSQFDSLKTQLGATTKTVVVNGKQVTYAVVKKVKGVKKNSVYDAIGVPRNSERCKIVTEHNFFFLFLLPGVS